MKIIECNLQHNGNFTRRSKTDEVILHHAEASSATVWDINAWHLANGWTGIGYHYYIRKDGSVYRGRPEWAVGAHATGHNDRAIGICCEGAYMTETMPAAQLASLKALLRDIMGRYGTMTLLRHKDVNSTDCPGKNFPWAEAQRYMDEEKEDDEVVEIKTVEIDGAPYECGCIMKGGENYMRLRDMVQAGYGITYDAKTKTPGIVAPMTRPGTIVTDEETLAAMDKVQAACGLEEQTMVYLLRYQYGGDLLRKLAAAIQKEG